MALSLDGLIQEFSQMVDTNPAVVYYLLFGVAPIVILVVWLGGVFVLALAGVNVGLRKVYVKIMIKIFEKCKQRVSEVFSGRELCIINAGSVQGKVALEKAVVELGGEVVQNPTSDTHCVVAASLTVRVKNLMAGDAPRYNVVKAAWLQRCVERREWLPWVPTDMWCVTPQQRELFSRSFDEYGDSYLQETSVTQLRDVFSGMSNPPASDHVDWEAVADAEDEAGGGDDPDDLSGLFRRCVFYVDRWRKVGNPLLPVVGSPLEVTELEVRMYGGQVRPSLDRSVTHCLVDLACTNRLPAIRQLNHDRDRHFHIVCPSWVHLSLRDGTLRNEAPHAPP